MSDNLIIGFEMLLVGLTAVFVALSVFALLIFAMKKIDFHFSKKKAKTNVALSSNASQISPAQSEIDSADEDIPAEIIAVLTAAANSVLGKKVVLRRFVATNASSANWANIGRQILLSSHQTKLDR